MLSDSNDRLASARRLTNRRARRETGLFLAEGVQAVREAIAFDRATEVFATHDMSQRYAQLLATATVPVDVVSEKAAASLSETVTPQGLVAVTRLDPLDIGIDEQPLVSDSDSLVVVLVDANDPGNAGTILRTADAAGATTVIFAGDSVDPYNGKCVRASAGSLFHVTVRTGIQALTALTRCRQAGLQVLATTGQGRQTLDELIDQSRLAAATAWVFGNEAHGLSDDVLAASDVTVRVPIYGAAESLNLAAAAAVCLYASAREQAR